jgi:hypothetical protein
VARYAGKTGVAYIGASGGSAAVSVVGLSKWSLDQTTEKIEVTAFGDTNKVYVIGLPDVKISLSGFWDDTSSDTIFQATASAQTGAAVNVYLYPSSLRTNKYWYGTAWLDAQIDADVKDAVKVSASGVGGGAWGRL